jgi:hypothetical protein
MSLTDKNLLNVHATIHEQPYQRINSYIILATLDDLQLCKVCARKQFIIARHWHFTVLILYAEGNNNITKQSSSAQIKTKQ